MNGEGVSGESEMRNREILERAEVSLILDDYDEIFSDFDPRPASQRALSVDFLDEAKRATRELKTGDFELRFLVPLARKRADKEGVIRKRLKEHFRKHLDMLDKEKKKIMKQGFYFLFFGLVFMFVAAYVLFYYHASISLTKELLVVMLEPGGWFLFWEGLNLIIFKSNNMQLDREFYKKMTKAEVIFNYY